jgi:uncharacterized membrane protein YhaH (DUF805 family)
MEFYEAVRSGFSKYAVFSGRASRSEYWFWYLFTLTGPVVDLWIGAAFFSFIFYFITLLPSIAVGVRRLHDVGRSGWWWFLGFTVVGIIPLVYWACKRGDVSENRYGAPVIPAPHVEPAPSQR